CCANCARPSARPPRNSASGRRPGAPPSPSTPAGKVWSSPPASAMRNGASSCGGRCDWEKPMIASADRDLDLISAAQLHPVVFARKARNLLSEPAYQAVWPGVGVAGDSAAALDWNIAGRLGGYVGAGVGGGITGKGADLLLIDDPFKNRQEAESETIRAVVWD